MKCSEMKCAECYKKKKKNLSHYKKNEITGQTNQQDT